MRSSFGSARRGAARTTDQFGLSITLEDIDAEDGPLERGFLVCALGVFVLRSTGGLWSYAARG